MYYKTITLTLTLALSVLYIGLVLYYGTVFADSVINSDLKTNKDARGRNVAEHVHNYVDSEKHDQIYANTNISNSYTNTETERSGQFHNNAH